MSVIATLPNKLAGIPFLDISGEVTSGNIYWVSSLTGSNDNNGTNPNVPFATIDFAIGQCTSNKGDVIYVMPGHTETISAAGGITLDVAGVSVVGLGQRGTRPTITWTATAATFRITAANCRIENLYCDATGINAVVTPFSLEAAGFTMKNCEVYFAKTSYVALTVLTATTAAAANNLLVQDCYIHGDAAANCTNAFQFVGGSRIVFRNNRIIGAFTTSLGCINNITAAVTDILIDGNVLVNTTAVSTKVIVLLTASTGQIVNNRIGILNGTAPITADAVEVVGGNYYKAAVGVTAGTLL